VAGIVGLSPGTSVNYVPNLIQILQTDLVISEAVFAFYFTSKDQTSYFDIGHVDLTAMFDSSNLHMQKVVTSDNKWT
jgi:hypothetical protein